MNRSSQKNNTDTTKNQNLLLSIVTIRKNNYLYLKNTDN